MLLNLRVRKVGLPPPDSNQRQAGQAFLTLETFNLERQIQAVLIDKPL
jgi:hypothetical protein